MVRCLFISVYPASSTTHRKHFMYYKVSESRVSHCCFTSYLKYLAESLEFSRCSKEKAMAPHSSSLAWKIPWTEEPGRLQSMGSLRVRHDWVTSLHFSLSCIGEGNGNPLQCSCLENPRDSGAWWAAVHGVTKSQTRLSDLPFTFHFHALEKETATHSSVLAWRIPGTAEPGGLQSMESHRVGHDWSNLAAAAGA